MSYQVLARKWRPQKFSEVAGQEHIVRTLQNALRQQRVAHAYLLVGPRGTGKTTTARIFAKALNCETGVVEEPCCECVSCRQITSGNSLDVVEIDGASHNKVEDIRELRENVQYTPSRSRFKIYIIDEVHMLSNAAWNALLKTLEEPPPHIKFFFATTEPHKVLPTILSRCQRFDLKRLPAGLIAERLKLIARAESVEIDDRALAAIGRAADGGMRDGQSIFDQVISFCGGEDHQTISEEDVISVFGLAAASELKGLVQAILADNLPGLIELINHLADRGRDLERVYSDLLLFIRNLLVTAVSANPETRRDAGEVEMEDIRELAANCEPWRIQRMLDKLADCENLLRTTQNKRVYLEVILLKVMRHVHSLPIDQIISRLKQLSNTASDEPLAAASQDPEPEPAAAPAAGRDRSVETAPPPSAPAPEPTPGKPPAASGLDNRASSKTDRGLAGKSIMRPDKEPPRQPITTTPFDDDPPGPETGDSSGKLSGKNRAPTRYQAHEDGSSQVLETASLRAEPKIKDDMMNGDSRPSAPNDGSLLWQQLCREFSREPPQDDLPEVMAQMKPVSWRGNALIVAYDDKLPAAQLGLMKNPDTISSLEQKLHQLVGHDQLRLVVKRWSEKLSNGERRRLVSSPEVRKKVELNSFVQSVVNLFGGEIIDARG